MVPMNRPPPVRWLQWALAFVIGRASVLLLFHARRGALHGGVHPALVTALAGVELAAVILFLIPKTLPYGARLLQGVIVAAALLHMHSGEMPPAIFLVYVAGIWVVLADARRSGKEAT